MRGDSQRAGRFRRVAAGYNRFMATPIDSSQGRAEVRRALLRWFAKNARELPWRGTRDPYVIWLSEVMLQQTRVDQARPYFERFLAAFPTVESLAAASRDDVLRLWQGLGYYHRAHNLHKAAQRIVSESGGTFPATAAGWRALPGVGRYTAAAIACIAFNEPVAVVDGNVARVLARLYDVTGRIDETPVRNRLWRLAEGLLSKRRPGDFNQALMELGACVCRPKAPACPVCPVRNYCRARAAGVEQERPVRRAKNPVPSREYVVAVIEKRGRYLLVKRADAGLLAGLWEFPNAVVRSGETHHKALDRLGRETLRMHLKMKGLAAEVKHAFSHFKATFNAYACGQAGNEAGSKKPPNVQWVARSRLCGYPFPKAHDKIRRSLLAEEAG